MCSEIEPIQDNCLSSFFMALNEFLFDLLLRLTMA